MNIDSANMIDITDMDDMDIETLLGYVPDAGDVLAEAKAARMDAYARYPHLVR